MKLAHCKNDRLNCYLDFKNRTQGNYSYIYNDFKFFRYYKDDKMDGEILLYGWD